MDWTVEEKQPIILCIR